MEEKKAHTDKAARCMPLCLSKKNLTNTLSLPEAVTGILDRCLVN